VKGELMKKRYCSGCRDNFYNGNNDIGVKECWNFKRAKIVWRIPIGHWENPPYKGKKRVRVASCWQGEGSNRTHYVKPEAINREGYWKW
jgi:hypothetical protein